MTNEESSPIPSDHVHDDVLAVAEYRSVSKAAVLAAVLGVTSLLAIFTKVLLVLPLLGALVALLAIFQIARSEGALVGRTAAIVGLVLSVVVGTAIVSRHMAMKQLIAAQAGPWAVEWCELVRADKLEVAIELTGPSAGRRPIDDSLPEFYRTDDAAQKAMTKFRENQVIAMLVESDEDARVEPGKAIQLVRGRRGSFTLVQSFTLCLAGSDDAATAKEFRLEMQKSGPTAKIPGVWHVRSYDLAN